MENNGKIVVSAGEILYWLFFGTLLFAKGIGLYDGQTVFKLVLLFSGACLLMKLAIEKYSFSEMLKIVAVIGVTGITYIVSGDKGMLLYGFMMVGMKYVNTKRVFAFGTIIWTLAFCGLTVCSLFRMDDTVYKVHDKLGMGHMFRWGLGYSHPNVLHISYIILGMFLIYILGERFKVKHAIYLFLGNCIIFLYSVSYTGFFVFICLLLGRLYLLWRKKLGRIEKIVLQMVFPLCVMISLIFPVLASGRVFDVINTILSTRLALAKYYLNEEFITLFGNRVSEITSYTLTMDNAYLFAFISYGIVPFLVLCIAMVWMIYWLVKREKYLEVLITLVIAIGGLTEPFLYNTSFKNLSFLFMGSMLFETKQEAKQYSILPSGIIEKLNKKFEFGTVGIYALENKIVQICRWSKMKFVVGIMGAMIGILITVVACKYPTGYVVYRLHCGDVGEEMTYYDSGKEMPEYKEMAEFEDGDLVEYFSGSIVKMEKLRNGVLGMVVGYGTGYILVGLIGTRKKERCNR